MTFPEILDIVKKEFGDAILEAKHEGVVEPSMKVSPAALHGIAQFLRDTPGLQFDYLMSITGMDYGKGTLGAVYHIGSTVKRHRVTLKVEVPKEKPDVPSLSSVWPTANWHEREAFDLLGIIFIGHPELRRILLPDDWEGHPLRKDYKVPEFYRGMKVPY